MAAFRHSFLLLFFHANRSFDVIQFYLLIVDVKVRSAEKCGRWKNFCLRGLLTLSYVELVGARVTKTE